jgi:DNA-binding beta-propeller fold protein YncE
LKGAAGVFLSQDVNITIADTNNHRIRMLRVDGTVSTIAGRMDAGYAAGYTDGPASEARFQEPYGVTVDEAGNIYVADTSNHCIRVIAPAWAASLRVTTLAGSGEPGDADGPAGEAQFRIPEGIAVDPDGNIIVADTGNHRIRKIVLNP